MPRTTTFSALCRAWGDLHIPTKRISGQLRNVSQKHRQLKRYNTINEIRKCGQCPRFRNP
jgi:hypothetical protein